jgi:TonB family protein
VRFAAHDIIALYLTLTATHKSGSRRDGGSASSAPPELRLLPAWPGPFEVFRENLLERLRRRIAPAVETSSAPDHGFWQGVDLQTPLPRRGLRDSVFAHAALLGLLYAVSIWPQASVHLADSRSYRTLNGYGLSPYLPELHGAPTHRRHEGKADPVPARQEIRSLPDAPDNLRQTIVAPPKLRLQHDVELPNLVAYEVAYQPAPPQEVVAPAAVIMQAKPLRALPKLRADAVQPAPEAGSIGRASAPNLAQLFPPGANPLLPAPRIAKPVPAIVQAKPLRALPNSQPGAVQPAPEAGSIGRASAPNLAQLLPPGANPIPLAPHAVGVQVPQVVALNLHPAEAQAPVTIPEGNRRGAFAASPSGHANATGTPGAGDSSGAGAHDASAKVNAPAGIRVGPSPLPEAAVAAPNAPSPRLGAGEPELRAKSMAAMRPPAIASIPSRQPVARESTGTRSELENHVFAGRRAYTLAVNMPNLNSSTGSWIIHFVDREQGLAPSAITAPEVVSKFDPAYPGELIRDGVQGTVVLTAVIRANGSVSDIAVAQSVDPQLDQNAVQALSRWLFRPALKDGQAIDLVAVITVPFQMKATKY